jgi:antitoxin YefM
VHSGGSARSLTSSALSVRPSADPGRPRHVAGPSEDAIAAARQIGRVPPELGRPARRMRMAACYRAGWKVAILIAMSVAEQMSLADVKNRLSEVVDRLQREHGRVVITKHGHPAAVVISVEDLESLEETLDIMDNAGLLSDIRQSLTGLGATGAEVLSKEEALRLIAGR